MKFFTAWFLYWEGALVAYFFGLWWAAVWCLAFFLVAVGIRIGRKAGSQPVSKAPA